jgi:hypothetical protein
MVVVFSSNSSATFDEMAHLPAGYSYLRWNDYRLNPEHPPLIKKWAALPVDTAGYPIFIYRFPGLRPH